MSQNADDVIKCKQFILLFFRKPEVRKDLDRLHEECLVFQLSKLVTILSLSVRLIITTAF